MEAQNNQLAIDNFEKEGVLMIKLGFGESIQEVGVTGLLKRLSILCFKTEHIQNFKAIHSAIHSPTKTKAFIKLAV